MKIKALKINSFGNIENKELKLDENTNIIYGKNEAGKSTLLKYITCMLYGISKNKRGKDISDYDKYKPWNREEFSGKLSYTLDNGQAFEIFRDFHKKNPKLYNESLEEISNLYHIDKTKGNEFFVEQTKVDEELFLSTVASMQQEVKLDKATQNTLIQKLTNLISSGDDNISYKKVIDKLNKQLIEEVGTDRSQGRPINIVEEKINQLKKGKQQLELFSDKKYDIEKNIQEKEEEIQEKKIIISILNNLQKIEEEQKLKNEKIKIQKLEVEELSIKKKELQEQIEEIKNKKESKKQEKSNKTIMGIALVFILIIISILVFLFLNKIIGGAIGGVSIISLLLWLLQIQKQKRTTRIQKEEQKIKIKSIQSQIELLEENIKEKENNIENIIQKEKKEKKEKIEIIKQEFKTKIGKEDLDYILQKNNVGYEAIEKEEEYHQDILELHKLELDKANIIPKLDQLAQMEEKLYQLQEERKELNERAFIINKTKELLENAYYKMKNSVTPKFTKQLSKNIGIIAKGKYKNVRFNDENGLVVELENGDYIPADRLSIGTIDQLYLSLRLAVLDELTEETLPIILDEAFAYYDTERLENILKYMNEDLGDRQIIILTCTNREEAILNKLEIPHQYIQI